MRLIARLDVKNEFVIKGIHLEGLRKVGNPLEMARKYYQEGADEILLMDCVASLYSRGNIFEILKNACKEVFIPITIGGGLRTLEDVEMALHSGADKVAVNTAAIKDPEFISKVALKYGSQCITVSIEAKLTSSGKWEAYIDTGREKTGVDALEWAKRAEDLGAGELLVTSIDREGTKRGFETELVEKINSRAKIPVIASGGAGNPAHVIELKKKTGVSAIACASIFHYNLFSIPTVKEHLSQNGVETRMVRRAAA